MEENQAPDDLVIKYQKLASEYSKMRAQVSVLKRAVTDEQAKNTELKDLLNSKDQSVRKLEQEVECLNFRNQQLTKRVAVLQEDFDSMSEKLKKSKNKHSTHSTPLDLDRSVLDAELRSKIEENERLHSQVEESNAAYTKVVEDLNKQIEQLQAEMIEKHKTLNETLQQQKTTIAKLNQEKAKIEVKLKNNEKELKDARLQGETWHAKLETIQSELEGKLSEAEGTIKEKLPFVDTKHEKLNSLNVPILNSQKQREVCNFLQELGDLVSGIVHSLSDLHTYMEQKVKIVSDAEAEPLHQGPLSKLSDYLHENARYLKRIEETYLQMAKHVAEEQYLIPWSSSQGISDAFSEYVNYLLKLLPYILHGLHINTVLGGSSTRIVEKNVKLQDVATRLTYCFSRLDNYLRLLSALGVNDSQGFQLSNSPAVIRRLYHLISDLHSLLEELKKVYSSKMLSEHELPMVTEKMKATDQCILSSLVSLVSLVGKVYKLMEKNVENFLNDPFLRTRGMMSSNVYNKMTQNPVISRFRKRGAAFVEKLSQVETPISVPYEIGVQNRKELESCLESKENLSRQLAICEAKLTTVEQAKEHWMLECQLLQVKYERETKKLQELEGRQQVGPRDASKADTQSVSSLSPSHATNGASSIINTYGPSIESPSSLSLSSLPEEKGSLGGGSADEEREVTAYLKSRISQLIAQVHAADSKAAAFHAECCSLHQRLLLADQSKKNMEKELAAMRQALADLKEELLMTVKNYENQLVMMSEHLANMNEKLALQKDEIDELKQANKASKKSKGK